MKTKTTQLIELILMETYKREYGMSIKLNDMGI